MALTADGYRVPPTALLTVEQSFTGNWANIGAAFKVDGYRYLGLWFNITIGNSLNVRFKLLPKIESTGNNFESSIKTVSSIDIKLDAEYYEFNTDSDQLLFTAIELFNLAPWLQMQVKADTPGLVPGKVVQCHYSLGK